MNTIGRMVNAGTPGLDQQAIQEIAMSNARRMVERETALTLSTAASPFGCCNFFDSCADEIFSLYYKGTLDLLDWMGFNVSDECYRVIHFIEWVRPEQSAGADTAGYISDPCTDPNGIEFGTCTLSVEDFGRYGREGPARDIMIPEKYCKTRPRYFLDGTPVQTESMWDMTFTMDQILNDIRVALITGNSTTAGQFDGLQRWVRTGYDCQGLNSYVLNWNNNSMDGGGGITLNGAATNPGFNIVDWLLDLHRNIMQRISWSPLLRNQTLQTGDMILVMPTFMTRCLLDYFACWSVCPGAQYEEIQKNLREINDFRFALNGGMFGNGQISLDGHTIPLLGYDWGLINGPTRGDMYLLTGAIGSQRIWEGEHLSAETALSRIPVNLAGRFESSDGGRVLVKMVSDNECYQIRQWIHPRLWCMAPWAQVRIQNVVCQTPSGPLSPNPADTSFFITSSFDPAVCP